jgi:hypothetical protein
MLGKYSQSSAVKSLTHAMIGVGKYIEFSLHQKSMFEQSIAMTDYPHLTNKQKSWHSSDRSV